MMLGFLLIASFVAHAQTLPDDTPAPVPVADTPGDGVIWEEEYIPQTPTAPPDGPTKLPPRSVRIQAEVQKIEDGGRESRPGQFPDTGSRIDEQHRRGD